MLVLRKVVIGAFVFGYVRLDVHVITSARLLLPGFRESVYVATRAGGYIVRVGLD